MNKIEPKERKKERAQSKGSKSKGQDLGNRKFFSNIKAQLHSIRSDVSKLVQKQGSPNNSSMPEPDSQSNTGKSLNSSTDSESKEINYQTKLQILESQIRFMKRNLSEKEDSNRQYKKKQCSLMDEVKRLETDLASQKRINIELSNQLEKNRQNERFLEKMLQSEKKQHEKLTEKLKIQIQRKGTKENLDKFSEIGSEFEKKINQYIEENYSLKNQISSIQNQLEQKQFQIQSLTSTIQTYQARDQIQEMNTYHNEIARLNEKIEELKQKNDTLESNHEYEIMKLENEIDELKNGAPSSKDSGSLNQIIKDQLVQIQHLRSKVKQQAKNR